MEDMENHDEHILMQFINSWNDRKANINDISCKIVEELVVRVGGLSPEGKNWHK